MINVIKSNSKEDKLIGIAVDTRKNLEDQLSAISSVIKDNNTEVSKELQDIIDTLERDISYISYTLSLE